MAFTDDLLLAAQSIWEAQVSHPFVRGIGNGTLEEERFKRWVLQDYVYLQEFARVFAWGVAKSTGLREMSWYASALDLTLNTEMDLHRKYAERFGISADQLEATPIWPTTRAYTDFLVRTAADGDMADLVAGLLPCAWGYVFVAQSLAADSPPQDQRYADWIEQYVSAEFEEASNWLKEEMNRLATGADDAKRERLTELFVVSSRYELQFWEMCWTGEGGRAVGR